MQRAALAVLILLTPLAQAFPDRPLTVVMPYPATGSPDIDGTSRITKLMRTMQRLSMPPLTDTLAVGLVQLLSGALGETVNLERIPASNTVAGALHVAQATPDGHTLLFAGNPTITIFPSLYRELPFNPHKDLAPVALFACMPVALIAASDNPAKTARQVIERARLMPGKINYAALGDGSTAHLMGEWFRASGGAEMVHVNYNGSVAAINAVATHNVELGFVPLASALPFLNGGTIRIFALTSVARHPSIPEVPTLAESGLAGFDSGGWFGVFAPAATPKSIIAQINQAINKALAEDFVQRKFSMQGLSAAPGSTDNFRALIKSESERWAKLLKTPRG